MLQATKCLRYMQRRDFRELDFNLNLAKEKEAVKDLSFGRWALSIPEQHLEVLKCMFPDLRCQDNHIRQLAWKAFMKNDLSTPYKINANQRTL